MPDAGIITIVGMKAAEVQDLRKVDKARLRRIIEMVFQDHYATLDPRHSVAQTLSESLRVAKFAGSYVTECTRLLQAVGPTPDFADRRPA